MQTITKSWQTTLVGGLAALAVIIQPISDWLKATTHITPVAILALAVAIIGALASNKQPSQ